MTKHTSKYRKYRRRLFFTTTTVCLIIVSIILWMVYLNMRSVLYRNEKDNSHQLLLQVGNNTDYMMRSLYTTTLSIYNSYDTKQLMYCGQKDQAYDYIKLLNNITENFVTANSAIHSIYIYNNTLDTFFSTYRSMYHVDEDFVSRVENNKLPHLGIPIVREVDGQLVCTHMVEDVYYNNDSIPTNAVFINYKLDWILDNINIFADSNQNASLFILDKDKRLINAFMEDTKELDVIKEDLIAHSDRFGDEVSIIADINGTPSFIARHISEMTNWQFFKIVPLSDLNAGIDRFRNTIIIVNLISFIFIIALYFIVTEQLYKPVDNIVALLQKNSKENYMGDEFSLVESYYLQQINEINELKQISQTNMEILEEPIINRLISRSNMISQEEFDKLLGIYKFHIDFDTPYRIVLCSFDDMERITELFDVSKNKMSILLVIKNIIKECFGEFKAYDYAYSSPERMTILLNSDKSDEINVIRAIKKLQSMIEQKLSSTICCALSGFYTGYKNVSIVHANCVELLKYKLIAGTSSILTNTNMFEKRRLYEYNFASENRMFEAIENNNFKGASKEISGLVKEMRKLDVECIQAVLMMFTARLKRVIYALNCGRHEPINLESVSEMLDIENIHFVDDFHHILIDLFELIEPEKGGLNIAQIDKVEQAIKIISENYSDPNICATYLADQVDYSAARLGRLFKQRTFKSIPEYINEVRLNKAATWIKSSNLTISEIAKRTGYHNESYFFKVFKNKFGITPRMFESKYRNK